MNLCCFLAKVLLRLSLNLLNADHDGNKFDVKTFAPFKMGLWIQSVLP